MDNLVIGRPGNDEAAPYYYKYIEQVKGEDGLENLQHQYFTTLNFLKAIPQNRWDHRYEAGKWSIKEVIGHMLDAERIFTYRALRIARGDATPMQGFDQDSYVPMSGYSDRTPLSIIEEYKTVRQATYSLFENLDNDAILRSGEASGYQVTCRAMAWIILGHEAHHISIIKDRYL